MPYTDITSIFPHVYAYVITYVQIVSTTVATKCQSLVAGGSTTTEANQAAAASGRGSQSCRPEIVFSSR